jgi:hypothetical protein
MDRLARFRQALAPHLGHTLTPELCAALEHAAFATPDQRIDPGQFGTARCGSYTFAVESFAAVLPDLRRLHEAHWQETERHRHGLALAPDYEAMAADERAGRLVQFTARHQGALVGNLRVYLGVSRHTGTRFATEDTLYLVAEHRGGRTAMRFVQYAERCLVSLNVKEVRATAKLVNGAARFLEGCGYRPVATELVKFL